MTPEEELDYAIGSQLPTRDGRVFGNAIIIDILECGTYILRTDFGNVIRQSEEELRLKWYAPYTWGFDEPRTTEEIRNIQLKLLSEDNYNV